MLAIAREVGYRKALWRTLRRQFCKRLLRREQIIRLPNGLPLALPRDSCFASEIVLTDCNVDWGSERLLRACLGNRGAFLDIGANIGYYSLYMADRSTEVFAFEPDPRARLALEANARRVGNITVVPCAVAAAPGRSRFQLERHCEVSHLSATSGGSATRSIEVELVSVDSFVAARKLGVEAIKIDCEGADTDILRGGEKVLREQRPIVLGEFSPGLELFALAKRVSYRVFARAKDGRGGHARLMELRPENPARLHTKMLFLVPNAFAERFTAVGAALFLANE